MEQMSRKELKRHIAILLVCIILFNLMLGNNPQAVYAEEVHANKQAALDFSYNVSDNLGTISGYDVIPSYKAVEFITAPVFNTVSGYYGSGKTYFSGNISCKGTLTLRWSENVLNKENYTSGSIISATNDNGVYSFEMLLSKECKNIYFYAEDSNGNYTTKTVNLDEDNTPPKIKRVTLSTNCKKRSYGNFFTNNIIITINKKNITDNDGVGVKSYTLLAGTGDVETGKAIDFQHEENDEKKIITISNLDKLSRLWIEVEDLLGNSQSIALRDLVYTIEEDDEGDEYKKYALKSNFFIIDKKEPTIQIEAYNASEKRIIGTSDGTDVEWFVDDISGIIFTANDEDSGVNEIEWRVDHVTGNEIYTPSGNDLQLTQTHKTEKKIKSGIISVCNLTEYLTKRTFQRETIREEVGNDGKPREIKGFGEFHREKMKHL